MNMMAAMGMSGWTESDMRQRFWIALVLAIPLIAMSGAIPWIPLLVRPPASNWPPSANSSDPCAARGTR
jgi:hypothetical protein